VCEHDRAVEPLAGPVVRVEQLERINQVNIHLYIETMPFGGVDMTQT
jgi:hypothetical protein